MAASREQIEALIANLEQHGVESAAKFFGTQQFDVLQQAALQHAQGNIFLLFRQNPDYFGRIVEQARPGYFDRMHQGTRPNTGTISQQNPFDAPRPQTAPQAIGPYTIKRELGRGAMGVVYQAHDSENERDVAIKTLLDHSADIILRFEQERKNLAKLNHPNVVRFYSNGKTDQNIPYFAVELVEGAQTLENLMRNLPAAQDRFMRTATVFEQIAQGLAHAHDKGVVHRDIKPANVLIAQDGTAKVSDFGLAKNLQRVSGLTQEGDILGTLVYMPLEQLEGDQRLVGPHSDVYSFGATLYHALTGKLPHTGANMYDLGIKLKEETIIPPREIDKTIPLGLEQITLKALQKNPADRYANGTELAEALSAYVDNERRGRTVRNVVKRGSAAGAIVLGLLGALAGVQTYRARGAELDATKAREAQAAAEAREAKTLATAETDRQNREYNLLIAQAREAANAKRWDEADRRMQAARALRPTNMTPDVRQLEAVIRGDIPVTIAPINSNPIFWQISEMTRNGEVPVANSRSTGPQNVTLKRGHFYNLEAAPEGRMDYRHLFRMDDQTRITLRSEPRIQGQVVVNGRARPLPEFYLIANDTRDFYFSAVPTSIGQYVLFLNDKGIDVRDRTNALRPSFLSNNPALPLTQMNLAQANAYCTWLTEKLADAGMIGYRARLPTPREVELAAAPHSGWTYPWGYDVNPTNNDGTITNVYDAATLQRALETNDVASLLRPLTISDNLLGVAASRAKHWGNIRRLASEDGRVYAVGASFMENDESLHQFRRDNQGTWLYRRQMTDNQPDAATGFSVVIEKQ